MPFRTLLTNTTPKGKAVMAASAVGVLVLMFVMFKVASAPSYATMLTGLDPAETGKITAALDEKGVKYEIKNNGTALGVVKSQIPQARIALAEKGLPGKGQPGFELFDKQKLGASDFQQKVTYQRALEGQIASTIGQVQGVSGAQVSLVLPEDQLFSEEQSPATAAVLLSGLVRRPRPVGRARHRLARVELGQGPEDAERLDHRRERPADVAELRQRAATAPAPPTSSPPSRATTPSSRAASTRCSPRRSAPARPASRSRATSTSTSPRSTSSRTPRRASRSSRPRRPSACAAAAPPRGGASGSASNLPSYAGSAAGGSNSNYQRKSTQTDFGVDKTVQRTKVAPGQVNRLSVGLVVDKSVPAAQVAQLKNAVSAAAGVDAKRGDVLNVSQVAFAKPAATTPAAGPVGNIMDYAKYGAAGLGILAFLFFMMRQLKRRERESLGEPTWLRQIEAPTTLADLEAGRTTRMPALPTDMPEPSATRVSAESIAEKDPERVAQQIRTWMEED